MIIEEITDCGTVDCALLSDWMTQLAGTDFKVDEKDLEAVVSADNSHLFMMKDETSVPCGMITVSFAKLMSYGLKATIDDVFVSGTCRGLGYGRALVEFAKDYAKSCGAKVISLTSSPSRIAANALYASCGFNRRETNVYQLKF